MPLFPACRIVFFHMKFFNIKTGSVCSDPMNKSAAVLKMTGLDKPVRKLRRSGGRSPADSLSRCGEGEAVFSFFIQKNSGRNVSRKPFSDEKLRSPVSGNDADGSDGSWRPVKNGTFVTVRRFFRSNRQVLVWNNGCVISVVSGNDGYVTDGIFRRSGCDGLFSVIVPNGSEAGKRRFVFSAVRMMRIPCGPGPMRERAFVFSPAAGGIRFRRAGRTLRSSGLFPPVSGKRRGGPEKRRTGRMTEIEKHYEKIRKV